jgi:hypothetical protein
MRATPEFKARIRAVARVIGPWLAIVPSIIIVVREPEMGTFLSEFFGNGVLVWFAGGLLLFSGLLIIAFHQYWWSPSTILISLFGWFLALRGFVLMAAPQPIERGAAASMGAMPLVRIVVVYGLGVWRAAPVVKIQ